MGRDPTGRGRLGCGLSARSRRSRHPEAFASFPRWTAICTGCRPAPMAGTRPSPFARPEGRGRSTGTWTTGRTRNPDGPCAPAPIGFARSWEARAGKLRCAWSRSDAGPFVTTGRMGWRHRPRSLSTRRLMHTTLATRPLGTSDLTITTLGFGAWAVGGGGWAFGWGPQDDEQSIATIRHALERGINWIDTAAVYGLGHSEEVVRRALEGIPAADRPYIFTKCGMVWDESNRHGRAATGPAARHDPCRVRGVAPTAGRGADRPLSVPLARRIRHRGRGELVHDGEAGGGREGARRGGLELRCAPARALRGGPPRGFASAALFPHPAGRCRRRDPLVRATGNRCDRV